MVSGRSTIVSKKLYHVIRKMYNGVRKVYHGDRMVNHGVRKVYHGYGRSGLLKGFKNISNLGVRDTLSPPLIHAPPGPP